MVLLIMWRELRGLFNGHAGYVILAAHLLITGLLFNVYAVGATPRFSQEVLRLFFHFSSGMAMVSGILLGMRMIAEERQLNTLVLLRSVDKTVFLVQWEKTRRETVNAGLRQVIDAGADLAGIVLTQVDLKRQAQYRYGSNVYHGYYQHAYQKYYANG